MNKTPYDRDNDAWETGALGTDKKYLKKATLEQEGQIDEKLGLQIISIRLQKDLIEALKIIASKQGIGYQPYIRQLLSQHVISIREKQPVSFFSSVERTNQVSNDVDRPNETTNDVTIERTKE